jgi:hypothetical protein
MHLSGALIPIVGNGIHWGAHDSSWIRFANESGLGAGRAHALLQGPLSLCFLVKWLQTPRLLSNMFTNLNLTDMETGYKVFRREIIQSISIEEDRFGFEPEIIAKIARRGCRIFEVGISYYGRTYEEGKKIGWQDGFRALYAIIKYNCCR